MASLLFGLPNSAPGPDGEVKKKKIPKVAGYVAGAAFVMTTGLTLLVLPYVRQAAKLTNPTQFMSHRSLAALDSRAIVSRTGAQSRSTQANESDTEGSTTSSSSSPSASSPTTTSLSSSQPGSTTVELANHPVDVTLAAARAFNAREEKSLYGASLTPGEGEEGSHEPVSGLLGFKALGIATALVFGSAGLGALIVAKLMGVDNMSDFSSKMRESLNLSMPGLITSVNVPGRSTDGFDGQAIEQWVAKLEADDEEAERQELLQERVRAADRRPS